MKAVIAGGTGFLGSALAESLRSDGHRVAIVTRHPRHPGEVPWSDVSAFDGADVVINLAGVPLDARRWTDQQKASILHSRVQATEAVVKAMSEAARRPTVFLNSSAVGVYGAHGPEALTEESPPGSDFLASVCVEWEAAAMKAAWLTRWRAPDASRANTSASSSASKNCSYGHFSLRARSAVCSNRSNTRGTFSLPSR